MLGGQRQRVTIADEVDVRMPNWWNTIDGLTTFNTWVQISIVVFGVLTAVASYRISRLQTREASELDRRVKVAEDAAQGTTTNLKITSEKLATTSEKLAAAEQEIQAAKTAASQARTVAEESQKKIQPRMLTPGQRRAFVEALQGGPSGQVDIVAVLGDAESVAFAAELNGVLNDAGWQTAGVSQAVYTPNGPVGLLLKVHSKDAVPTHANTLQRALASAGYEAPGVLDGSVQRGYLGIVVGHKP